MTLDRRLWIPLLVAICALLSIYGAVRLSSHPGPITSRQQVDCSGLESDRPAACFH